METKAKTGLIVVEFDDYKNMTKRLKQTKLINRVDFFMKIPLIK